MTLFIGTSGNDVADAVTGTLTGFLGRSLTELQDGNADTFSLLDGNDSINAGSGSDLFYGSVGADTMRGNGGLDEFSYGSSAEAAGDLIDGGADVDRLRVSTVNPIDFTTTTFASVGQTSIEILDINTSGYDVRFLASQFSSIGISSTLNVLGSGSAYTGIVRIDNISGFFGAGGFTFGFWNAGGSVISLNASATSDSIIGSIQNDAISGGAGNDTLDGITGNDFITGGGTTLLGTVDTAISRPAFLSNNSIANAMVINSNFNSAFNANVAGSVLTQHVSVNATSNVGQGITHFYRVSATAGQTLIFDIDSASGYAADTIIRLYDAGGTLLQFNDDSDTLLGGNGSTAGFESFLTHTARVSGDYIIEVGRFETFVSLSNPLPALVALDNGATGTTYTLNISIAAHAAGGGDDSLVGGLGADILLGGDGNDTLVGGAGSDVLHGGDGDDVIVFSAGTDFAADQIDGGNGIDELRVGDPAFLFGISSSAFISSIEILRFTGSTTATINSCQFGTDRISPSVTLEGGSAGVVSLRILMDASNTTFSAAGFIYGSSYVGSGLEILGSGLANNITGSSRGDSITGNLSADTLNGGAGADTLVGGDGGDFYVVDNVGDLVIETNGTVATGGYDVVIASVNITLGANLEQLVVQGGATAGSGNGASNYLYGGNSGLSLTLDGAGGDDVIYSSLAGGNALIGGTGNDTLLIYGGGNSANGGADNDIYYTYSPSDVLSEVGGGGFDTVYANWNHTLATDFEQLLLFGAATVGVGNAAANIMYGNGVMGTVQLYGLDGADVLYGGAFNDTLSGGTGADILLGLGGADLMVGGADSDIYYVDNASDIVTELVGEGFDTIYTTANYTMSAETEQMVVYGGAASGTGNAGINYIYGNSSTLALLLDGDAGNDYLLGSAQADTLIGGFGNDQLDLQIGGNDFIRYNIIGGNGGLGADTVYSFDADPTGGQDKIDILGMGYGGVSFGTTIIISGGANTVISFTGGVLTGTTITLVGVAAANVTSADFVF